MLLQAKTDRQSPKAVPAETTVPRVRDPEESGRLGDLAPRSLWPPANSDSGRTAEVSPPAPRRARQAAGHPLPRFPQPPPDRPSGLRDLAAGASGQSRSQPRPPPARRRVRPHLTATRTELSSGAPHMLVAGDSRAPGPPHRRAEAPPEPRR